MKITIEVPSTNQALVFSLDQNDTLNSLLNHLNIGREAPFKQLFVKEKEGPGKALTIAQLHKPLNSLTDSPPPLSMIPSQ